MNWAFTHDIIMYYLSAKMCVFALVLVLYWGNEAPTTTVKEMELYLFISVNDFAA